MSHPFSLLKKYFFTIILIVLFSAQAYSQRTINDVMDSTTVNHLLIISKNMVHFLLVGIYSLNFRLLNRMVHKPNIRAAILANIQAIAFDYEEAVCVQIICF